MQVKDKILILQNLIKRKVSYDELAKILGLGSGQALRNRQTRKQELKDYELKQIDEYFFDEINKHNQNQTPDEFINIPVRGDVSASMGYGVIVDNERQTAVCQISPQLLKSLGANRTTTDIIFGQGDSMLPTINDGDALMVDRSQKDIIDGKIYAVRIDGQLLAKRLQKTPPNTIKVISDNPKYDSFYVDFSKVQQDFDFEIIGRVLLFSRIV